MRYLILLALLSSGCIADVDAFQHNPRHCSVIGPDTCENESNEMDKLCTKCGEAYPFAERGMPVDRVSTLSFETDGVTNDAYFIEAAPDASLKDVTILVANGNKGGIEHYLHQMEALYLIGANLFAFEYPGYGQSSSDQTPSETAFFANADAAYALLQVELQRRNLDVSNVIFYGFSLGALPAVHLARRHEVKGVILESPYPSASLFLADSSATSLPASFILSGNYDNLDKLPDVTEPIFLMHSQDDAFIRIEHSERLYQAMNDPKCFWRTTGAAHGISGGIPITEGYASYAETVAAWIANQTCPQ